MLNFGEIFSSLRQEKGLSQIELGKSLGISNKTVSAYEKGERKPDLDMVVSIAIFFSVTTDFLLGRSENQKIAESVPTLSPESKEHLLLFNQLDEYDKSEIRGEIKGMLRHEKYATLKPSQRHA